MNKNNNNSTGGIGFTGLLTIVFIVLKLLEKINWSWWWVLSPIWITILTCIAVVLIWFIGNEIIRHFKKRKAYKNFNEFMDSVNRAKEKKNE